MKILLTIEDISYGRGAERVTVNLANALVEEEHEVSILSFYQRHPDLPYTTINPSIRLMFRYDYKQSIAQESAKKQFLKGLYYKNIHKLILSYELKNANYDIIISSGFIYFPYFKNPKTKYIKIIHTSFQRYSSRNKYFDILAVLSVKELPLWQKYYNNIKVIPNFIPQIPSISANYKQKVVISIGSLTSEKGFLRLLDIWKAVQTKIVDCHESLCDEGFVSKTRNDGVENDLNEWKLIIVGDGVLKSEIESKIRALNLGESVLLKPFTKDIEREYLSASIYAMASHFEGFPMVLLESTAYGLAPISFDIATGPSDIIENNKSGFLIPDNDLESYAEKLIALMRNESMRKRFGSEAKRIVEKRFSKEFVLQKWEKLFRESHIR